MKKQRIFQQLPTSKAYRLLESGPIVLVATGDGKQHNVMTMGFHMMLQHEPPLVGCVIGPWDFIYQTLRESGECMLAQPTVELAKTVTKIGNCSGSEIDKFKTFGLTSISVETVASPLIRECLANLECKVADTDMVERYNLFILEVTKIWVDTEKHEKRLLHHAGDGAFIVDGERVDMREHMTRWHYRMD